MHHKPLGSVTQAVVLSIASSDSVSVEKCLKTSRSSAAVLTDHSPTPKRSCIRIWTILMEQRSSGVSHISNCVRIVLLVKMQPHRWPSFNSCPPACHPWQHRPPFTVIILLKPILEVRGFGKSSGHQQRGLRFLVFLMREIQYRFLETRIRYHPSNRP